MANNFQAHWFRLCRANNGLLVEESKMTISVASFKKQLQRAYDAGVADRAAVAESLRKESRAPSLRDLLGM